MVCCHVIMLPCHVRFATNNSHWCKAERCQILSGFQSDFSESYNLFLENRVFCLAIDFILELLSQFLCAIV